MTIYATDWATIQQTYHPNKISEYVERGLEKMYFGTAPTLADINERYGKQKYEALMALLIDEIFKFAGLKEKFTAEVMDTISHMIRTEYPWLKITELMHFVYLFRLGQFDKFYGKPNGATLMQMLRQYVKGEREKTRAEFLDRRRREEQAQQSRRRDSYSASVLQSEIAKAMSEEETQKNGAWRYRPWGTAMCRAYFVDGTLTTWPGAMDERQQQEWAQENAAYVSQFPNLNLIRPE